MTAAQSAVTKGKWIETLTPQMAAVNASRHILEIRLGAVCDLLPLAVRAVREDPKVIKRLRVATRRAEAALIALAPCFKKSRCAKLRKDLRHIRRAAGHARICDVHAEAFAAHLNTCTDAERPAIEYALARTFEDRGIAQQAVNDVAHRHRGPRLRSTCQKLLKSAKSRPALKTLVDLAKESLPVLIAPAYAASNEPLLKLENLHELRRKSKRLRYSLEFFRCCFSPTVHHDLYQQIELLQERLGPINDADELAKRLHDYEHSVATDDAGTKGDLPQGLAQLARCFEAKRDADVQSFAPWFVEFQFGRMCRDIMNQVGTAELEGESDAGDLQSKRASA